MREHQGLFSLRQGTSLLAVAACLIKRTVCAWFSHVFMTGFMIRWLFCAHLKTRKLDARILYLEMKINKMQQKLSTQLISVNLHKHAFFLLKALMQTEFEKLGLP